MAPALSAGERDLPGRADGDLLHHADQPGSLVQRAKGVGFRQAEDELPQG